MIYTLMMFIHLLTSVLGIGQIAAIAVVSVAAAPGTAQVAQAVTTSLVRLTRAATWSILVMLVTGVAINLELNRAYDRTWWFRISTLLLLLLGYLLGRTQRALRKADEGFLARVATLGKVMCALVVLIVALMAIKP